MLVQGFTLWVGRPMACIAVGASVLGFKLPHHAQHSHSLSALRTRSGNVISSTEQTKTCSMGTAVLEREQLVLSWAQAGPLVPNTPSLRRDRRPLPTERRMRWPGEGAAIASWGMRWVRRTGGVRTGFTRGLWPASPHSHKEQIKHPEPPRRPQLQGVLQFLQEIFSCHRFSAVLIPAALSCPKCLLSAFHPCVSFSILL